MNKLAVLFLISIANGSYAQNNWGIEAKVHSGYLAVHRPAITHLPKDPVFAGEDPGEDVLNHRKRIEECDTIVLIAPIWNFRMPAIVEGWIDKVLAPPWAFKFKQLWGNYGYPIGNLRQKKAIIFCTYGSPRLAITTFFLNLPIRRLKRGVFHMCGIYNIVYRRYFAVPFVSEAKRKEFLEDVKKTANNI